MAIGDSPDAGEAFELAWPQIAEGHPGKARESLALAKTEDLVRLHRYARVTNGLVESILIERLGAASAAMLLAAKG